MTEILETAAAGAASDAHLFFTTHFTEYTVTEGLLLLIVLGLFGKALYRLLRRFF